MTNETENFLTPAELVERYRNKITLRTLANWRSIGEGPQYTKVGGRVLYRLKAVIDWEKRRTQGAAAAAALYFIMNNGAELGIL